VPLRDAIDSPCARRISTSTSNVSSQNKSPLALFVGIIVYLKVVLRRCGELYREGGIREVCRGVRDYIEHDLGSDYQERRSDNQDRWEFISSHIDEDARSLIDIGCAEGEFAARPAEMGLNVTGFDRNVTRLHTARTEHAEYSNLRFEEAELIPETIDELPEADVILFLTVHHHWVKAYGWDEAANMVRTLLQKGGTVIYESPGHMAIKESTEAGSLDPANSINYYTQLLESEFGDTARIVDTMLAEYKSDSNRADPVFVLDSITN